MLYWRKRCIRAASDLIADGDQVRSIRVHERAFTRPSILIFRNGLRNGTSIRAQHLHQRAGYIFQKHRLKRNSLSPFRTPKYRESSPSASLSIFAYTLLSISGIFVVCASTGAIPHRLDSWNEPDASDVPEAGEAGDNEIQWKYKPAGTATLRDVDAVMAWDTVSNVMHGAGNIFRYDTVRIPSNPDNGEDRTKLVCGLAEDDELWWIMPCIFDGHAGSRTADVITKYLPNYIARNIVTASPDGSIIEADPRALDRAIKEAFVELDQDIMNEAVAALESTEASAIPALEAAFAGSCAILSYYDIYQSKLKVACTGDSRTVLGRLSNTTGKWEAIALSEDQTGHNKSEVLRLQQEHPNEPDMIKGGRLLGLAVTRAFGDSRWKWSQEFQELGRDRFFGPQVRDGLLTPPYLTAEPEITTTEIQPENGDFIIQASDGLWDALTNEEAVNLVGKWLEQYDPSSGPAPFVSKEDVQAMTRLPDPETESPNGQSVLYHNRVKEEDWIVKDENAASHLARNALGGRNETRLRGMFSASAPFSREMRDDISIQVLFFRRDPNAIINT